MRYISYRKWTLRSDSTSNILGLFLQRLSRRYDSERNILEENRRIQRSGHSLANSSCCTVNPEIINFSCGFETWMQSLVIVDETSLFLDLFLLQDLSAIIFADPKDVQLVRYTVIIMCVCVCYHL